MLPMLIAQGANEAMQSVDQIVSSSLNYALQQKEIKAQEEETGEALQLKEREEEDADDDRLSKMMLQSKYARQQIEEKEYQQSMQEAVQARQQNILNHYLEAKFEGGGYKKVGNRLSKKLTSEVENERNL